MVAASGDMNINVEDATNSLKETFERATVVDNNQAAETNF
jgi:hypothetical protein